MGSDHFMNEEFASYRSLNRDTNRDFTLFDEIGTRKAPKISKFYQADLPDRISDLFAEKREANIVPAHRIFRKQRSF